ncbi:hypothetical protein M0R45_031258 [Rubus argutus]|uniref:Uncharacterized protein n=1 Tax=Rubus argutus TaxID=59490 RepID=A0AAW1WE51_RUBAR
MTRRRAEGRRFRFGDYKGHSEKDKSRKNASLTTRRMQTRVMEAMRGISFAEVAPGLGGSVAKDEIPLSPEELFVLSIHIGVRLHM